MKIDNLEQRKAELINNFISLSKGKNNDDMLPLLFAVSSKAKKEGISFTPEDTAKIISALKEGMSIEEQNKIDMFMTMLKSF